MSTKTDKKKSIKDDKRSLDKTPIKNTNKNPGLDGFSPISVPQKPSPSQKNLTGYTRVIRDIAIDVHNNIQKWNKLHLEGCHIVKNIVQEKANNQRKYTADLETYINELYDVCRKLEFVSLKFTELATQGWAVGKIRRNNEELFSSIDSKTTAEMLDSVSESYKKEYAAKMEVLQNIAHTKNKSEAMFYASCWTLQCHVTHVTQEYLEAILLDLGIREIEHTAPSLEPD